MTKNKELKEVKLSPEMQACVDIYNLYSCKAVLQMPAALSRAWKLGKKEIFK